MIIKATQKNTRQTALKVRLVANQVRKLSLTAAITQLGVIQKRASLNILKLIRQAIADAVNNHGFTVSELTLKNITVTVGPTYKRFRAVSRGRAHTILKRTCHITVELEAGVAPIVEKETLKKVNKKEEVKTQVKKATAQKKAVVKKTSVKKAKK
jgi:large subunit ribosomal protein L22